MEFSKKDNEELIEEYLHNKISDMYKQINNYIKLEKQPNMFLFKNGKIINIPLYFIEYINNLDL